MNKPSLGRRVINKTCLFLGVFFLFLGIMFALGTIGDFWDMDLSIRGIAVILVFIAITAFLCWLAFKFFWLSLDYSDDSDSKSFTGGLETIEPNEPIPDFKYHPAPLDTQSAEQFETFETIVCDICDRLPCVSYNMFPFYTTEHPDGDSDIDDVDVCLDCIKSGDVTRKYSGKFNDPDASDQQIFDIDKREELSLRTPGLFMEHPLWLTHCNDYCAVITNVYNWQCLEDDGLAEEVENDWVLYKGAPISTIEEIKEVMHYDYKGEFDYIGLLFRCIHCGKHRLYIDSISEDEEEDEDDCEYDE